MHALEIFCLEPPTPVNGEAVWSSQEMSVGTMTTYSCDSGYVLVGQATRTCEDARGETIGIWSGTTPICEGTNNKKVNSLSIVNKLLDCITNEVLCLFSNSQ